jgi:hypothetical protein
MNDDIRTIAIDFDGTLCELAYPCIGHPRLDVIDMAISEQLKGSYIILWTCRTGRRLLEAVAWCKKYGLEFDAVNENIQDNIDEYGSDCRKVFAHEYWDDKAVRL